MTTVKDVVDFVHEIAPPATAESWDNVGLQIGDETDAVRRILVSLDCTPRVADLATAGDLIITHHPLFFKPVRALTASLPHGPAGIGLRLARNQASLICAHTNIDSTRDCAGTNSAFLSALGLDSACTRHLEGAGGADGMCPVFRAGDVPDFCFSEEASLADFARHVLCRLRCMAESEGIHIDSHVKLSRTYDDSQPKLTPDMLVALCTGSGGSFIADAAAAGAELLITGDVGYHTAQDAAARSLAVLDLGHFGTEVLFCVAMAARLRDAFADVEVEILPQDDMFMYID